MGKTKLATYGSKGNLNKSMLKSDLNHNEQGQNSLRKNDGLRNTMVKNTFNPNDIKTKND